MSCVLRAAGAFFDVDAFLSESALVGATVFRRGEARQVQAAGGPTREASGFNLTVSAADFENLPQQIQDASRFLREHEDELRRLGAFADVEEVCLDFGIRRRDVPAQTDVFPADLLWQAGALDIDLVITHYQISDTPAGKGLTSN